MHILGVKFSKSVELFTNVITQYHFISGLLIMSVCSHEHVFKYLGNILCKYMLSKILIPL